MKHESPRKIALGADFRTRALTALIGGSVVIAGIIAGSPFFDLAVMTVGVVAGLELVNMLHTSTRTAIIIVVVTVLACIEGLALDIPMLIAAAVVLFIVVGAVRSLGQPSRFLRDNYLYLLAGALYIGIPLGLLLLIRNGPDGLLWTAVLFVNNWTTDSAALIGGRIFGKNKLAPSISPGKTIEGAAIGLLMGFTLGLLVALAGGVPLPVAILVNAVLAPATEIGDLFESWTKRRLAVKDSGSLLPGHGGFLDRIDGVLLAAPLLYILLRLVV